MAETNPTIASQLALLTATLMTLDTRLPGLRTPDHD